MISLKVSTLETTVFRQREVVKHSFISEGQ